MMQTSLGRRLRILRAERGLSLRSAASMCGVTKETLSAIERGSREPHDVTLSRIARGYEIPVEELLEEPVPLAPAPSASPPPPSGFADDVPQTMEQLLEAVGADGRELALPLEEFRRLYEGRSYEEVVRLNKKILAQRQAIEPIVKRWRTMPPGEDRKTLHDLWSQAFTLMFAAVGVYTEVAHEMARAEPDAAEAEKITRLAKEEVRALVAAA